MSHNADEAHLRASASTEAALWCCARVCKSSFLLFALVGDSSKLSASPLACGSRQTYLPTYLPRAARQRLAANLPTYLPTYLPARRGLRPQNLPTYLPTYACISTDLRRCGKNATKLRPCRHLRRRYEGAVGLLRGGMKRPRGVGRVPSSPGLRGSAAQGWRAAQNVAAGSTPEWQLLVCWLSLEGTLIVTWTSLD